MPIPANLIFNRGSGLLIVDVMLESTWCSVEFEMLQEAIEIMEKANEFKGCPIPIEVKIPNGNQGTVVQFSIIFPSEASLRGFIEFYKNNE